MKTILCMLLVSGSVAQADTLYLRNGKTLRGTFISGNSRQLRFLASNGRTQQFLVTAVDHIVFGDAETASSNVLNNSGAGSTRGRAIADNVVPAGTVLTVRMIDAIDSHETDIGRGYRASIDDPIVLDAHTIAPRGADATITIARVGRSGTVAGREEIALVLTEITANGRRLLPATHYAEMSAKSRGVESANVIGAMATQAIRGQHIQVPSESRLDLTLAQPMRY